MLLAVDIGNTNISFGIFKGDKLLKRLALPASGYNLKKLRAKLAGFKITDVVICSVVPKLTRLLAQGLRRFTGRRPYIIGKDFAVPIKNLYRCPGEVGQDRLINAYAAILLYGAPVIAIDFGTAVTFDVISRKKEYLGGLILPGLNLSLDALNKYTALLPRIKLNRPDEFIGRDTRVSMLSGIVYGFAALADDLSARIKNKIGRNALVIGTGGDIKLILDYCRVFDIIEPDLTLKGINLVYQKKVSS